MQRGASIRLLTDRNFGPFFLGNLCSNCGTWFQNLAQTILVYRLTHSVFLIGVVNFAQFGAVVLLAPWAGSCADRFNRRRLLAMTQIAAAVITAALAGLAAAGVASVAVVIGLALVLGVAVAFAYPVMHALVPALVPRAELATAIGLHSVTFNVARAAGPVAASVTIATLGIAWAFAFNACSYLVLAAALLVIRPREVQPQTSARLRDSIPELRRNPRLIRLLLFLGLAALAYDPVATLTAPFAVQIFHQPDTVSGYLIGVFGLGGVASITILARPGIRTRRVMVGTLAMLAIGIVGFGLAPALPVALAALFVAGFAYLTSVAAATTQVQLGVDERHRGRVMALWSIAFIGTRPIGSLVDGGLASAIGLRPAALAMGCLALIPAAVLLVWKVSPGLDPWGRKRQLVKVAEP